MDQTPLIAVFRFSIQLFMSEAVFLTMSPRRERFALRLGLSLIGYGIFGVGCYKLMSMFRPDAVIPYILFWICLFALSLCVIILCFDLTFAELLFTGVGGYATEHIAFAAAKVVQYATGMYEEAVGIVWENFLFRFLPYVMTAAMMYFLVIRRNQKRGDVGQKDTRMLILALVILFTAVVLSGLTDSTVIAPERSVLRNVICPLYSLVCAVLVILIEFYFSRENRLTREREVMEQMLQMSYAQQKTSKEAIDIINIKCHDLKHQMGMLARIDDADERHQYINEMKRAVSIYDATYHTGCESLDYIMREKTLLCDEYGITLSCMAEGEAIRMMSAPDIYSLFGNILDNAIESARREEVQGKRLISFRLNRKGRMIHIHEENTCTDIPQFTDGLPITTKEDRNSHGYGVRSIQYVVDKYRGEMLMRVRESRFILDILFPEE